MTNRQKTVILNAIENSIISLTYAEESPDDCEFYIHTAIDWLDDLARFVKSIRREGMPQVRINTESLPGIPDVIHPTSRSDDTLDGA